MAPRVDTPLARALLDAGKVEPSGLERALAEQIVHGGTLDTLLLELGLVDEPTLARLLAEAWGTESVPAAGVDDPDPDAVRALPERIAVTTRICPYRIDEAGLHVMVSGPLDRGLVGEIGTLLARAVVAHVVPEVRLWQGLARAYGVAPDERFVSLIASVSGARPRKVTPRIDEIPEDNGDVEPATWDLAEAFAQLAAQDTRDGIVHVAVRFARKALPFAAMLGVRGTAPHARCQGWLRSGPAEGVQFVNTPLALPPACALATCLESPAPFVGRPEASEDNAALFGWLGRRRPRTFVAVPVVVAGRAVAALVGDGGVRAREVHTLGDLVSFGARLGSAFEALLRQRQKQHPSLFPVPVDVASLSPSSIDSSGAPAVAPVDAPSSAGVRDEAAGVPVEAVDAPPHRHAAPVDEPATLEGPAVLVQAPHAGPRAAPSIAEAAAAAADEGDAGSGLLRPPAPPPPPPPRPSPRPITMSMPAVRLEAPQASGRRDGTSPFARAYSAPASGLPASGAPERAPPSASPSQAIQAPAALQSFAGLSDATAPTAWRAALQSTVERGHQGGTGSADDRARIFLDDNDWEDVVLDAAHAASLHAQRPTAVIALPTLVEHIAEAAPDVPSPGASTTAVRLDIGPPAALASARSQAELLEELVDDLAALDAARVAAARAALLASGAAAVAALARRFPGRLLCDPFDAGAPPPTSATVGPLIDVLAAFGAAGLDAAVPHLDSRFPAHRYCAVLLFAHTPDPRALELLRPRLHDQEPRIQRLAADALAPFVSHPQFIAVLTHLRERLGAPLVDARRRAAQLLGAFRDVGAVPSLIALLDRGPELAEEARGALRLITLQDHGVRTRSWEKWWSRARKRSRVDWLLEGLASDDRELRSVAALELSAMAGEDFGFHPDADRASRRAGEAAFGAWWSDLRRQRTA